MSPKLSHLLNLWMCGVKTASHNRDFDLETTLGPSVSDLFWGKNEEIVLEALRARCPSCFLTSLSLFYKWSCRCRSAATQRRAAGERSSTVAGLCRLGPVRCVGTAVASPRQLCFPLQMRSWQSPGPLDVAVCWQMAWQMGHTKRVLVDGREANSSLGNTLDKKLHDSWAHNLKKWFPCKGAFPFSFSRAALYFIMFLMSTITYSFQLWSWVRN